MDREPNRIPDYIFDKINVMWFYPEMIWSARMPGVGRYMRVQSLIEIDNELYIREATTNLHKLWPEAQKQFKEFKIRLDKEIDIILLDGVTDV